MKSQLKDNEWRTVQSQQSRALGEALQQIKHLNKPMTNAISSNGHTKCAPCKTT